MLVAFLWLFAGLSVVGAIITPIMVGRPREPISNDTAIFMVAMNLIQALVMIAAAQSLS